MMTLTYCGYKRCVEGVLRESEEDAGLAHSGVTDQEQFEQIVVGFGHFVCFCGRITVSGPIIVLSWGLGYGLRVMMLCTRRRLLNQLTDFLSDSWLITLITIMPHACRLAYVCTYTLYPDVTALIHNLIESTRIENV